MEKNVDTHRNTDRKTGGIAILLAAGAGRRMGASVAKQYLLLRDKPVVWYGLQAFEASPLIREIVLVTAPGEVSFVQREIVEKYGFQKVSRIVEGGKERYQSVANALEAVFGTIEAAKSAEEAAMQAVCDDTVVLIHDAARPLVTQEIIARTFEAAVSYHACIPAVPVKDTIKQADENGFVKDTPQRESLYQVQTPQAFTAKTIVSAYEALKRQQSSDFAITDDAMVVEEMLHIPVKLVEGSYENIKITTPEDMGVALSILSRRDVPYTP